MQLWIRALGEIHVARRLAGIFELAEMGKAYFQIG